MTHDLLSVEPRSPSLHPLGLASLEELNGVLRFGRNLAGEGREHLGAHLDADPTNAFTDRAKRDFLGHALNGLER